MVVFILNTDIEIWRKEEMGRDEEYLSDISKYVLISTCTVNFQPYTETENEQAYGSNPTNLYKVFLDEDVDVKMGDTIRIVGEKDTYTIIGEPKLHREHLIIAHISLICQPDSEPRKLDENVGD